MKPIISKHTSSSYQPKDHCWTKASRLVNQRNRVPATLARPSLHHVGGLPILRLPVSGRHSRRFWLNRLISSTSDAPRLLPLGKLHANKTNECRLGNHVLFMKIELYGTLYWAWPHAHLFAFFAKAILRHLTNNKAPPYTAVLLNDWSNSTRPDIYQW